MLRRPGFVFGGSLDPWIPGSSEVWDVEQQLVKRLAPLEENVCFRIPGSSIPGSSILRSLIGGWMLRKFEFAFGASLNLAPRILHRWILDWRVDATEVWVRFRRIPGSLDPRMFGRFLSSSNYRGWCPTRKRLFSMDLWIIHPWVPDWRVDAAEAWARFRRILDSPYLDP